MASAAREACGAGTPAGHGGKCTIFAEKPGTFPEGGNAKCSERGLWSRCPGRPRGKVHQNRGNSRNFPGGGLRKPDDSDAGAAALDMLVGKRDYAGSNLQKLTNLLLQHTGSLAVKY